MARKKSIDTTPNATGRHLWLAGLGLASMAARQTAATAAQTVDRVVQTRQQARAAVEQAQSRLIETAGDLRARIEAGVAQVGSTFESAVSPLIARFKPAKAKRTVRRGRKPVAKTVRRTTKKTTVAKRARKA
jgi:hypothetical protein